MGLTAIDPAISVVQSKVNIQKPQLTGNPRLSTTVNVTDPNFKQLDGHLDEINPSQSNYFDGLVANPKGKYYNTRNRGDRPIPAYTESRDSWDLNGNPYRLAKSIDPKEAKKEC